MDNDVDEFIELANITASADALLRSGTFLTNTWRMRGGVGLRFSEQCHLPPVRLCAAGQFQPDQSASALSSSVPLPSPDERANLFGPYSGQLDNAASEFRLLTPDAPDLGEVPDILVDEDNTGSTSHGPARPTASVRPSSESSRAPLVTTSPIGLASVLRPALPYVAGGNPPVVIGQPGNVTARGGTIRCLQRDRYWFGAILSINGIRWPRISRRQQLHSHDPAAIHAGPTRAPIPASSLIPLAARKADRWKPDRGLSADDHGTIRRT